MRCKYMQSCIASSVKMKKVQLPSIRRFGLDVHGYTLHCPKCDLIQNKRTGTKLDHSAECKVRLQTTIVCRFDLDVHGYTPHCAKCDHFRNKNTGTKKDHSAECRVRLMTAIAATAEGAERIQRTRWWRIHNSDERHEAFADSALYQSQHALYSKVCRVIIQELLPQENDFYNQGKDDPSSIAGTSQVIDGGVTTRYRKEFAFQPPVYLCSLKPMSEKIIYKRKLKLALYDAQRSYRKASRLHQKQMERAQHLMKKQL